ncbi:MAG TPA: glycoside hydrolase family 15 protein [Bacillales bacterium]|nr:glycoside hydrolase family 15 protein [Bacillales bacterium]
MDLKQISVHVIKKYQHISGAYVASPCFENYKYCWLRDGSFIAYSMDCVGEHESAGQFYEWVHSTILKQKDRLDHLLNKFKNHEVLRGEDFLPCRYTLEGKETKDDWPNFQLDGYGTWLWGLCEHIEITNNPNLLKTYKESIEMTICYLCSFWKHPNSDCWEENENQIHPSTLACIYGGLQAMNRYYKRESVESVIMEIKNYLKHQAVLDGRFVKHIGSTSVDASLLWLAVPFRVFDIHDPYMKETVRKIESDILFEGGVRRFPEDTYYGGGEWILLSGWLGWYYKEAGRQEEARKQLDWMEAQADNNGLMPEQSIKHVNDSSFIQHWTDLWGDVAKPLLWSHALYLILQKKLTE